MTEEIKKHVIAILVDNEFGALARIVELFSGRGYNIESLNVAPITKDKKLSRITITTYGSKKTVDLICKLLNRIIPVYNAVELTKEDGYVEKELALVKIIGNEEKRSKAIEILDKYRSNLIDLTGDAAIFEIIGTSEAIDDIITKISHLGIDGVSRTGVAAGFKGEKKLTD
ncbi:acetolactate synthase small subunit [Rickettsiales bacterium]|nr:acetolactate synthase small subunit [Rickettsiales bacterium]